MPAPKTIDDYLAGVSEHVRPMLVELRKIIATAVPEAVESISYQMPTFKYRGKPLVYFAAFKSHCSLFPASGKVIEAVGPVTNPDSVAGLCRDETFQDAPAHPLTRLHLESGGLDVK